MMVNDILDAKINSFLQIEIMKGLTTKIRDYHYNGNVVLDKIRNIVNSNNQNHREYILKKIYYAIEEFENTFYYRITGPENVNKELFGKNKNLFLGDIILMLDSIDAVLSTEMYTKEEFQDLLSRIDKIAESLFSFQQKSAIANEIIYDSIDEIKEQLKTQAEKGKIFGKEFVEQQLAGKIMDMAFKGSFFAMLSHAPEQISEIADHVKGLL